MSWWHKKNKTMSVWNAASWTYTFNDDEIVVRIKVYSAQHKFKENLHFYDYIRCTTYITTLQNTKASSKLHCYNGVKQYVDLET